MIYTLTTEITSAHQATYENMVMSFRYYTGTGNIGSALGEETDRPSFYQ